MRMQTCAFVGGNEALMGNTLDQITAAVDFLKGVPGTEYVHSELPCPIDDAILVYARP